MEDLNTGMTADESVIDTILGAASQTRTDSTALKAMVRTHGDSQKARMAHANRVLQAACAAAGIITTATIADEEDENAKLGAAKRDEMLADYDAIVATFIGEEVTKLAKKLNLDHAVAAKLITEKGDPQINPKQFAKAYAATTLPNKLLATFSQFQLCALHRELERAEARALKHVERALEQIPVWNQWLVNVRGCGPAIGGVILASIDIAKAEYPSSLWRYAGLDVGPDGRGRSKRPEHLVERSYLDKDGKEAKRMGVTHNPELKTRLFLLATSFIKAGGPYRAIYDDRKLRLESHPVYGAHNDGKEIEGKGKVSKGRRHMMAMREMQKRFLVDLYKAWRTIEGLPVAPEYSEAKLGLTHGSAAKYS
jgi:hypothetical protein